MTDTIITIPAQCAAHNHHIAVGTHCLHAIHRILTQAAPCDVDTRGCATNVETVIIIVVKAAAVNVDAVAGAQDLTSILGVVEELALQDVDDVAVCDGYAISDIGATHQVGDAQVSTVSDTDTQVGVVHLHMSQSAV